MGRAVSIRMLFVCEQCGNRQHPPRYLTVKNSDMSDMSNKQHPDDEFVDWRVAKQRPRSQEQLNQPLDPLLAARIKRLRLPPWPGLTPVQEEQRVRTVENMKAGLSSALIPIAVIPVFWFLFLGPFNQWTPLFREELYLLRLWPSNSIYIENFLRGNYPTSEQNFFFSMTSTISAVWLVWLIWRIFHELGRRDTFYIQRWLPGFAVLTPIAVASAYFNYFRVESSFGPSLVDPISVGVIKVLLNISIFYYMIYALIEQILLYIRRDRAIPPFTS